MTNNLFGMLTQLSSTLNGLKRDVDPNDKQDNTEQNLGGLVANFQEVTTILKGMESSDVQSLMKEYGDIFAGRETLAKNLQDIQGIINNIRARVKQDPELKDKLEDNLPRVRQGEDIESLFSEYQGTLKKLSNLQQKINSVK